MGRRPLVAHRKRIKAAHAAQHQAVERAETGDHDEHEEQCAADARKRGAERLTRALLAALHQRRVGHDAGQADVIEDIDSDDDEGAEDERAGEVALRVLELCVDAGRDNPALISERGRDDRCEQSGACF